MVDQPNWAEVISAIGACGAAIAAAYAAWLSRNAADQWRRSIAEQRINECVAAGSSLEAALGRVISVRESEGRNPDRTFNVYDQLWDTWVRFDAAFSVARRYCPHPSADIPKDIRSQFYKLERILKDDWQPGTAQEIQSDVGKLVQQADQLLKPSVQK